jgi:hypothetical protein
MIADIFVHWTVEVYFSQIFRQKLMRERVVNQGKASMNVKRVEISYFNCLFGVFL